MVAEIDTWEEASSSWDLVPVGVGILVDYFVVDLLASIDVDCRLVVEVELDKAVEADIASEKSGEFKRTNIWEDMLYEQL